MFRIIFFIWIIPSAFSDVVKEDYRIDNKLRAGKYLIYQCENKHFACVDEVGFQNCKENRKKSKSQKNFKLLDCAPLKEFQSKLKCVEESYGLIEKNLSKPFCFK